MHDDFFKIIGCLRAVSVFYRTRKMDGTPTARPSAGAVSCANTLDGISDSLCRLSFDLEAAEWRIPAERMKMRTPHIVPLAPQAVEVLRTLQTLSGTEGLLFPGDEKDPGYWDFVHFAFVIGVANQTADVQIASTSVRRLVTWHGIVAFVFNTVILALSINATASLF